MEEKIAINNACKQYNYALLTIIVTLIFLLIAVVFYKLNLYKDLPPATQVTLDDSCDLHEGSCKLSLSDGGSVSLLITPNTIPLLERLQVRVEVEGISATDVEIDFTGIGIDMGYNRPKLKAISDTTFVTDAFLPVCIQAEMDWNAKVLLHTEKGLIVVPYTFNTIKKSTIYDLLR